MPTIIKDLFQGYKDNIHSANSEDYRKYRNAAKSPIDAMDDMVEASLHAVRRNKGNSKEYREHDYANNLFEKAFIHMVVNSLVQRVIMMMHTQLDQLILLKNTLT